MLSTTRLFVDKFLKEHTYLTGRVLDVGSLDVSGNIRDSFKDLDYVGMDMQKGANVDLVLDGHDIKKHFTEGEFDLVVCFDTLEHDVNFWVTVENMKWVLKPGGYLLVGAPSLNHPLHYHPYDYWRFTKHSFEQVILAGMEDVYVDVQVYGPQNDSRPDQIFGWGRKMVE